MLKDTKMIRRDFTKLGLALAAAAGHARLAMTQALAQEKAIVPEKNPPGDIPDN